MDCTTFVQKTIGYDFANRKLLDDALSAAHRSDENKERHDGNRGLALMGIEVIKLARFYDVVISEELSASDANVHALDSWWNGKKERARVCEASGIGIFIRKSVRQGDQPPSTAVLDHALCAIFGAVWVDCEHKGKSASESREIISQVLHQVHASAQPPMSPSGTLDSFIPLEITSGKDFSAESRPIEYIRGDLNNNPPSRTELRQRDTDFVEACSSAEPALEPQSFTTNIVEQNEFGLAQTGDSRVHNELTNPSKKRRRRDEERAASALEVLLLSERKKLAKIPEGDQSRLQRCLEHTDIYQLDIHSQVLPFLYVAIGSYNTLADFVNQLEVAREVRGSNSKPLPFSPSVSEIYSTICDLENQKATCGLLKRYHAIQLLEEEQNFINSSQRLLVETPETMAMGNVARVGNPVVLQEAEHIHRQTVLIIPHVDPMSEEFESVRRKVKRFRQLAKRLQVFTNRYGIGILPLLPSGAFFSTFPLTDNSLFDIREDQLKKFSMLLDREQGLFLRKLSKVVEPALTALATFRLQQQPKFPIEMADLEQLREMPKAFLADCVSYLIRNTFEQNAIVADLEAMYPE